MTAYSGELNEELDQQRVVLGGIVTGMRTVITKSKSTMGVAMLEDLQGSLEVVVFPKVLEQTSGSWRTEAIVLVSGRVDHKGDSVVLLADAVWDWDEAMAMGPDAFARLVAAGERGRGRGNGHGNGHGNGQAAAGRPPISHGVPVMGEGSVTRRIPWVSPLRDGGVRGELDWRLGAPARPVAVAVDGGDGETSVAVMDPAMAAPGPGDGLPEPESLNGLGESDEPPFPAEAWQPIARSAAAPTSTTVARHDQALHVRFGSAAPDTLAAAFESLKVILREHPGETAVVVELPAARGGSQAMPLRSGVAYDSELLAAIERRLGTGLVRVELSPA